MAPAVHATPGFLDAAATTQPDVVGGVAQRPDEGRATGGPARRLSTQEGLIGQKLRSGTPHLHHFLQQTSPTVTTLTLGFNEKGEQRWNSSLAAARACNARRYSSADLVLHGVKACNASVDARKTGAAEEGGEKGDSGAATQSSRQVDSRDLSSATQTRPALSVSTMPQSSSPTSKNPTIEESSCEDTEAAEATGAPTVSLQAPVYHEDPSRCAGTASVAVSPKTAPGEVASPWEGGDAGSATKEAAAAAAASSPTRCISSSSASSVSSSPPSDASSSDETADTEVTSPERSPDGDETPVARAAVDIDKTFKRASAREPPRGRRRTRTISGGGSHGGGGVDHADRYGTPEMPRGTAKLPHLPAGGLTPRFPNHGHGHAKHLPRAEKLPMSGYELLASTISSSSPPASASASTTTMPSRLSTFLGAQRSVSRRNSAASFMTSTSSARSGPEEAEAGPGSGPDGSASLKPIYRRFEALNHRILLHMQDELSELEEQLHRLDTTDTQTRRMQSRILPASRRAEYLAGGELQWHKSDILGKIGFKLGQYNHVLSSFSATRDLPAPSLSDVTEYRSYLSTHQPITEVETRFLDTVDDLVTLAAPKGSSPPTPPSPSPLPTSPPSSGTRAPEPAATSEEGDFTDPFRAAAAATQQDEDALPPFPTVTPIPGTMHGNSWLMRHNRLPSMSERGHARARSQPTANPQLVGGSRHYSVASATAAGNHPPPPKQKRRMSSALSALPYRPSPPPPEPAEKPASSVPLAKQQQQQQHHHYYSSEPSQSQSQSQAREPAPAPVKPTVGGSSAASAHVMLHVAIAMAVAVLVPILAFSAVPGFVARLSVVLLVGLSAMGSVVQSGVLAVSSSSSSSKGGVDSSADVMCIAAVYAVVMAVVAGVTN